MREIKFRAWYKPLKIMAQSEDLESINFDTKVLGVYIPIETSGFHKLRMSDFELMQYTGISDKNGKEIFEGDIATITFVDGIKENFEVYYESNRARFSMRDKDKNDWGFAHTNEIEVIGDIYSNPELLEATP